MKNKNAEETKKMYSEFSKINKCEREGFKACYYNAGGYGDFKGKVIDIQGDKFCFKQIAVSYTTYDGMIEENKEDHVWVMNGKPFKEKGIQIGNSVSFTGVIRPYQRKDGTHELGIEEAADVEIIEDYELPSDEALEKQFIRQLKCESCLYREHCYGICPFE